MDKITQNHLKKYPGATEILSKRSLTAKVFNNGDGNFTMHAHIGHIHYKDKNDKQFKEINTTLIETPTGWEMRQASYEVELPKYADDWFTWINSFILDPRTGDEHGLPEERIGMRPVGAQHVAGVVMADPSDPWAGKKVLYVDAFGKGIDLVIQARNVGFDKLVVIREKPADLNNDRQFSFEIEQENFDFKPHRKQAEKTVDDLDNEAAKIVQIKAHFDGGRELEKQGKFTEAKEQAKIYNAKLGELEDEISRNVWDKKGELKTKDSVIVGKLKKSWFRDFKVWDSGGKRESVEVSLNKSGETIILTKTIKKEFLAEAQYPVFTDTTTSYYAGAGDGYVYKGFAAGWSTVHDASSGDGYDYTASTFDSYWTQESGGATDTFKIRKWFLPIDTSGIGSGATLSSATLYIYADGITANDDDGNDFATVVQGTQSSTSSLGTSDYNKAGSTEGIASGTRLDLATGSTGWEAFALNSTGRGWISTTGYTKLALRTGWDLLNHAIAENCTSWLRAKTSEETGTTYDPYLSVTYTPGTVSIEVTPSDQNATFATQSVTIDAVRNVESTPAAQTITGAILAAVVGIGAVFGATQVNANFATQAATIDAVRAVNVSPAAQNGTFALPASSVTAIRNLEVTPSVQNANFDVVAPTTQQGLNIAAGVQNATFATQSATITAVQGVNINAAADNATFATVAVTINTGANIGAVTDNATFDQPAASITAVRTIDFAATTQNATFAFVAPTVETVETTYVNPSAVNGTFATLAVAITAIQSTEQTPDTANTIFSTNAPEITAIRYVNIAAFSVVDNCREPNGGSGYYMYATQYTKVGQSFTGKNQKLTKISFSINKAGAPAGSAYAKVYAHAGAYGTSSYPTGDPLAVSDEVVANSIENGTIEFTFSGANQIDLVKGTHYCVEIEYPDGVTGNTIIILTAWPASHAGNVSLYDGSWHASSGNDLIFAVIGEGGAGEAEFATAAPTILTGVSAEPATVNASFATLAVTIQQGLNIEPAAQNATFAIVSPDISGAGSITVSPLILNATFAAVAPEITTVRFVEVTASAQNAVFAISAAAIGVGPNVEIGTNNATFALLSVSIQTGVNTAPEAHNAIFATQSVEITANRAVTVESSVISATFAAISPTITGGMVDVDATLQAATFALPAASITAVQNITISAAAVTGTFALPAASVSAAIGAYVSAGLQNALFATLAHGIDLNSVTLSLNALNADFYLLRVPTIYTDKYSAKGTIYTDKYSAKGTIYTDKYSKI